MSTIEMNGNGTEGKSRAHVNKMNCYVRFGSPTDEVFIYEQIHLGNKFPNHLQYLPTENIDKAKLIKVWDIDNCLERLNIQTDN